MKSRWGTCAEVTVGRADGRARPGAPSCLVRLCIVCRMLVDGELPESSALSYPEESWQGVDGVRQ